MVNEVARTLIKTLQDRVVGSDSSAPGVWERTDGMAWAALGLRVHQAAPDLVERLERGLAERQQTDGRVPLVEAFPRAWWPTSLSMLAWQGSSDYSRHSDLATQFLLHHRGAVTETQSPILGHDTTIHGWPWIGDTHSWVEPTSLALMALFAHGVRTHPSVREGVEVLRNRMLPEGGWNYGNTMVYGAILRPMPECTGVALCALKDEMSEDEVGKSLEYIRDEYADVRTPLSLGWAIMGLTAWGDRPADVEASVAESLALQERYGPFETSLIGLLATCLSDFPLEYAEGVS